MCCNDKQELMSAFIDGELGARDQLELFRHLAVCPDCQSFIDVMIRMRETEKKEQINFPAEIDETLLLQLDGLRPAPHIESRQTMIAQLQPSRRRITLSIPVAISAAAAAIVLGFLLNGIIYRAPGPSAGQVNNQSQYPQPTAVIFYYSMPPVEVTGTAMIKTRNDNNQQIFK